MSPPGRHKPVLSFAEGGEYQSARREGTSVNKPINLCLFDLDDTLLPMDSDHAWGEFMVGLGWVDPIEFARRNDDNYVEFGGVRRHRAFTNLRIVSRQGLRAGFRPSTNGKIPVPALRFAALLHEHRPRAVESFCRPSATTDAARR